MLMVHKATSEAVIDKGYSCQEVEKGLTLLLPLTRFEARYITVACHVVLKAMYETTVLVSMQEKGVIAIFPTDTGQKLSVHDG